MCKDLFRNEENIFSMNARLFQEYENIFPDIFLIVKLILST